jgi:hypothetical protein
MVVAFLVPWRSFVTGLIITHGAIGHRITPIIRRNYLGFNSSCELTWILTHQFR